MLFSRLGLYKRNLLEEVIDQSHEFTESWAREASVIPVESWPLFEQRRSTHVTARSSFKLFLKQNPAYLKRVLDLKTSCGRFAHAVRL